MFTPLSAVPVKNNVAYEEIVKNKDSIQTT